VCAVNHTIFAQDDCFDVGRIADADDNYVAVSGDIGRTAACAGAALLLGPDRRVEVVGTLFTLDDPDGDLTVFEGA
jgi:hypothetical protein